VEQALAGRDAELGAIDGFVDRLRSEPGALLLEGAPGIGKTTVWVSGMRRAAMAGCRILECRPIPTETPLAFVSLGDVLEPVLDEMLPSLPAPQSHALEVALVRTKARGERPDLHALSAGVLGVLRSLAVGGPVLLCIDDLQWLDRPSARVIEFAARRITAEPVGMLATWRTGPDGGPESRWTMPMERVELGPLSIGALQAILRKRLDFAPTRRLLLRIHAASGGNPFFAIEIARAIRAEGREPSAAEPLPIPGAIGDIPTARLRSLPSRVREALAAAALLTQPTIDLIESAMGDPERAMADLDVAVRAGVIELAGDRVTFTHPLLAQAAAALLGPSKRRRLHARLAEIAPTEEERAHHLGLATDRPDERVADLLERAAHDADLRGADDTAVDLSDWSVALTPAGTALDGARRRRMVRSAEYHFRAFDIASARRLLEDVVASAPSGAERADALVRLAKVRIYADRSDPIDDILVQAIEEADGEPRLRVVAHQMRSLGIWNTGNIPAAKAEVEQAFELAAGVGDQDLIAQTTAQLIVAEFHMGGGLRSDLLSRVPVSHEWQPGLMMEFRPNPHIGNVLRWADQPDAARERLLAEYQQVAARGAETDLPFLAWSIGDLEYRTGHWDLALRYADEGHQAGALAGTPFIAGCDYVRAMVVASRGELDEALDLADQMMEIGGRGNFFAALLFGCEVRGFARLSVGDAAGCVEALAPALGFALAGALFDPGQVRFMPDGIEANVMVGDLDTAERLLDRFEQEAERLRRTYALATGARCRGLLLAARGDLTGALTSLELAIEVHDSLPMPFERARTLLVTGEVQRRAKQKRPARSTLEEALEIFEGLGAHQWARRARAELDRVAPPATAGGLTATEERVARLVADGCSNAEVAATLFISRRTVEVNLSRIYRKLGVRSRTQLARALVSSTGPMN
jgi:DNA-binding CsgD family transcriptional regulator/tetratricopeptide (TPR) repeat protein